MFFSLADNIQGSFQPVAYYCSVYEWVSAEKIPPDGLLIDNLPLPTWQKEIELHVSKAYHALS